MNVIIIDDEKLARENIKNRLVSFFPNLSIVAMGKSVKEGLKLIEEHDVDILFLDIKMPGKNGFDLLESIQTIDFEIIFVTAFDEYAIKAFEFNAIGYLLKPIINEKLVSVVNSAIQRRQQQSNSDSYKYLISNMRYQASDQSQVLSIHSKEGIYFIKLNDIIFCEADGRYTTIWTLDGKKQLSSQNLAHFHKVLENKGFFQVHKSYIINTNHILKYDNEGFVTLVSEHNVPVSRRKKQDFLTSLGLA